MATASFQDGDILALWAEVLKKEEYRIRLNEIEDNYPEERSIFINFKDIDEVNGEFAAYLLDKPDRCLKLGKDAVKAALPADWDPEKNVNFRIWKLPSDARVAIRNLRRENLGRLVSIEGLVKKATLPKLKMTNALFICAKCDAKIWQHQKGMYLSEPLACTNDACNRTALRFNLDEAHSIYSDTQKIEIQENPEGLRGGSQPERIICYIEDDISGKVSPGDRITLNGVIRPVEKSDRDKSTIFDVFLDVMSIEFEQHEFDEVELTDDDVVEIKRMAADPNFYSNLIKSIAPTIFGMEEVKQAVALQLFGGTHKVMDDGSSLRGDIHLLLVGDPGVAKSQILSYMSRMAPRGIFTSGKSASAAGLCVAAETAIIDDQGQVESIGNFVNARMTDPEEYKPGIWRQACSGVNIQSFADFGVRYIPVSYVWRIKTPEKLYRITAGSTSLTLTPETKIQAMKDGRFDWVCAKDLVIGDMASIVLDNMRFMPISEIEILTDGLPDYVYDLTVDTTHAFVGNGFVIHNTAAAVKDDFGEGRYTLEAGALVLADKGLACIDELDKMSAQDTSSLHEAMESQRISIAKAGISATLQCRCSLLAAANPNMGRFNDKDSAISQIDLPPPLISRFDIIFALRDIPEEDTDEGIAKHILRTQMRGQARTQIQQLGKDGAFDDIMEETKNIKPIYDIEMIRKYVSYAKKNCFPVMRDDVMDIIKEEYLRLRKQGQEAGNISITARQLEAYIRLSEASAKSRLSNTVDEIDVKRAITLIRYYMDRMMTTEDGSIDADEVMTGYSNKERKSIVNLQSTIRDLFLSDTEKSWTLEELCNYSLLSGYKKNQIEDVIARLDKQGDIYCPSSGYYKAT